MAAPSLPLNEDINKCFRGLSESCEQNVISVNKLKKKFEKLKVKPEGKVATDKVNLWLGDLESLEGQATSMLENIKRISCPIQKIGPWGGPGAINFDSWLTGCRIAKVKGYTGDILNGLTITYDNGNTFSAGSLNGESKEVELSPLEVINFMFGSIKNYDGKICISKLGFSTDYMKRFVFGPEGGENFTVPIADTDVIVGFFGQYDSHINSIGATFV